jgi:hypothetical protein
MHPSSPSNSCLLASLGESGNRLKSLDLQNLHAGIVELPQSERFVSLTRFEFSHAVPTEEDLDDYSAPIPSIKIFEAMARLSQLTFLNINNGNFPFDRLTESLVFPNLIDCDLSQSYLNP